jgi:RNA polymerase sigma-70 factor (sigma-E family)
VSCDAGDVLSRRELFGGSRCSYLCVSGVASDFDVFVESHYPRLVRAARLLGPDPVQAEDLAQVALIRTLVHWDSMRSPAAAWSYTHTTLVHLARRSGRRRWWGERATATLPERPVPDQFEAHDDADAVRRALARLPFDQRAVLVFRYYLDLTESETAAVLGIPVGTVKSRGKRAVEALRADRRLAATTEEASGG